MVNTETKGRRRLSDDSIAMIIGAVIVVATIIIWAVTGGTPDAVSFASWSNLSELGTNLTSSSFLVPYVYTWVVLGIIIAAAQSYRTGDSFTKTFAAFTGLYLIATLVYICSSQLTLKKYLEYAFFALFIGIIIRNTIGVPQWLKKILNSEFYVKIGLILMGSEIIFSNITKFGIYGILIVAIVLPLTFWFMWKFGTKVLKMDDEKQVAVITTATSVCGVSAAVAASAAVDGDDDDLSYTVSMTMLFTIVMMVFMPYLVDWLGLGELVGGAWIGNTIDSTGAVVLAGEELGPVASQVAALVKMIQNLLIGVIVVVLAVYFARKEAKAQAKDGKEVQVTWRDIWKRMPKFIFGFIGMSIIFSFIIQPVFGVETTNLFIDSLGTWKGWFFCLTFLCIGLETDFREMLEKMEGGKPVSLYLTGQTFSVILSLIVCYVLLSGKFIPAPNLAVY